MLIIEMIEDEDILLFRQSSCPLIAVIDVGQSTFTRIVPVALPWVMLLA